MSVNYEVLARNRAAIQQAASLLRDTIYQHPQMMAPEVAEAAEHLAAECEALDVMLADIFKDKPPEPTNEQILAACDAPFECYDFTGPITLRSWLEQVLHKLLDEQDGFSGKRPFGNSGWIYYLGRPFVAAGLIQGDDEGEPANDEDFFPLLLRAVSLLLTRQEPTP